MRTADFMGVLFRSNLVKFSSKDDMVATDNPIIRQFMAGEPNGPIGMDEMPDAGGDASRYIEGDTAAAAIRTAAPPGRGRPGGADTERPARPACLNTRRSHNEPIPAHNEERRRARVVRPAPAAFPIWRVQSPAAAPHTVSTMRPLTT
jgi:hypothetical protein